MIRWPGLNVVVLLLLAQFSYAAEITGSVTVNSAGKHLWRGMNLYDGVVVQPEVSEALNKFELTYWASYDGMIADEYKLVESYLTLSFEDSLPFAEMELLNAGFISYMRHYEGPELKYTVELFA